VTPHGATAQAVGLRRTILAILALVAMSGCATAGAAFRADDRIDIVSPDDLAKVSLPVVVRWTSHDLALAAPGVGGPGVFFGVFVDRPALRPGHNLVDLVDTACKRVQGCANPSYFASQGIYLTAETSLAITHFPGQSTSGSQRVHHVVIVVIDQAGTRVGETVAAVDFRPRAAP
jgi:hypothetical protein